MFSFGQHVRAHVNSIEERQRRTLSDVSNSAGNANNESSGRAPRQPEQQQQGKNNATLETQEAFLQVCLRACCRGRAENADVALSVGSRLPL